MACASDPALNAHTVVPSLQPPIPIPLLTADLCILQVGGWLLIDRDDLKRVTPQWLSITKAVRADPEAYRLCGDSSVKKGERPWISEMYGYVFAAANNSVWHNWDTTVMRYPGYATEGEYGGLNLYKSCCGMPSAS